MLNFRVYWLFALFLTICCLAFAGCARKSGCAAVEQTVAPKLRKDGKPKRKTQTHLFDKRARRKM